MIIRVGLAVQDADIHEYLKKSLADADVRLESLGHSRSVWQKVMRSGCDVIIVSESLILTPVEEGIAMLNDLPENPTTVVLYGRNSPEEHAELAAAGADVVLYTGISKKNLYEAVQAALDSRRQFIQRKRYDRRGMVEPKISDFVTESQPMKIFMEEVHQVIPSDSPILLIGETGVGKEHLAKAIHDQGPRSVGPFISVNTAAIPDQLLESELFGHEQGAFTGAMRYRRGAFELAHGGTIFLDEIGEMPAHLQVKLLRVLQDFEIKPVGGENIIELDVRVIAATSKNLEEAITQGAFRQDLYYRLSVLLLTIPPLRDRPEDIPTMVRRFTTHFRYKIGREINKVSEEMLQSLCQYDWPGNVRELMNVIERAMLLCKSDEIGMAELPQAFQIKNQRAEKPTNELDFSSMDMSGKTLSEVRQEILDKLDRFYLQQALTKTRGRIDDAARLAGIHPRGLYGRMKQLGLRKEDFKRS
ncbi:MAG: sigma-54-dependent Fis family transcriptional regulator [Desulfobacteraceae bacterium]|nr:sigma-54-dependent Fis family transcriptional regulator [Desulfobacteraceae bacterium]